MNRPQPIVLGLSILAVAFATAGGYGWYQYREAATSLAEAEASAVALQASLEQAATDLENSRLETAGLVEQLAAEKESNDELAQAKRKAEKKADELEDLSKLDPELLAKYSRVFFLNENYTPPKLADVPKEYRSPEDKEVQIHKQVLPFLRKMLEAADDDDVTIDVASAYRSFGEQADLKGRYSVTYGTASNSFSADQGYSEHQLGTTVDLTGPENGGTLNGFEGTEAFAWLEDNAYRYGFVLSYPKGNSYYVYEPWHWRFVGEDLARYLHKKEINFYDMDQRKIDGYLGQIFD